MRGFIGGLHLRSILSLVDLDCRAARSSISVSRPELEACLDASCIRPLLLKPACVQAIAHRGLQRDDEAGRALARFDRIWQEALAVRTQAATRREVDG